MGEYGSVQSGADNYADANAGTGVLLSVSPNSTPGAFLQVGEAFDSGSGFYGSAIAYLTFDMTNVPTDITNVYLQTVWDPEIFGDLDTDFNVNIALYDYGSTLETADWLDGAALSALTPIVTIPTTDFPVSTALVTELSLASMNVGGITRLVVYTDMQAAEVPPNPNLILQMENIDLAVKRAYADPGTVTTFRAEVATDTPEVNWRLDETSGTTAADSSGNNHDGTYNNSPTLGATSLLTDGTGTAVTFSNADESSVSSVDDLYTGTPFSGGIAFEGLINAAHRDDGSILISLVEMSGGFEVGAKITLGTKAAANRTDVSYIYLEDQTGGNDQYFELLALGSDTTYHVIAEYDGDSLFVIYLDGDAWWQVFPGDLITYVAPDPVLDTYNLYVGGEQDANSIDGTIDEVSYYTHALSDSRARKHYKASTAAAITPAPAVTNISPNTGTTLGGDIVIITGTDFISVSAVKFGTTDAASFTVDSTTQITATSPAHAAGVVDITVVATAGTSATGAADQFTFGTPPAPDVTGISPTSGPTAGGTNVTITGTDFTLVTAVKFGATDAASFTVDSVTQITATSPAHAAGVVDITIIATAGTSATGVDDQFTYDAPAGPAVTSIDPTSGPTTGGTTVTITGTDFTLVTAVRFGATDSPSFTVDSVTQITAESPAHTAGMVDVTVVSTNGTSGVSVDTHFTYESVPIVTAVNPPDGNALGGTIVEIHGSGFSGASAVTFGATDAPLYDVFTDNFISVTAPAHAASTIDVRVTTALGTSAISPADHYTFVDVTGTAPTPVVRWTFFDPSDASTATFELNPDSFSTDQERNLAFSPLGPGEKTLVIASADHITTISFSGTILTDTMLALLETWYGKANPIELTDDLGRVFNIRITHFEAKRVRHPNLDWFHTYSATAAIIGA